MYAMFRPILVGSDGRGRPHPWSNLALALALALVLAALVTAVLLALAPSVVQGAPVIYTWNNPAGGYWGDATNWTPNGVPDATHDAVITLAGEYEVTVGGSAQARTLTLGAAEGKQVLRLAAGAKPNSADPPSTDAALRVGGGSVINESGQLLLTAEKTLSLGGVTLGVDSGLYAGELANYGTLRVDNIGLGSRQLSGYVDNYGEFFVEAPLVAYSGPGTLVSHGGITINSGCTFDAAGHLVGFKNLAGSTVQNDGTFHFTGGLGFEQEQGVALGNPIKIDGCTLSLTGAGPAVFEDVGTLSVTGTLQSNQSLIARAGNGYWPNSTLTIMAPFTAFGTIQLTSAGGGTSSLSTQGGSLFLAPGSHLNVDALGGGTRSLSGDITNAGTVDIAADVAYGGSGMFANSQGSLTVEPGRTFDASGNNVGFMTLLGSTVQNNGTFHFSGGLGFWQEDGSVNGQPIKIEGCTLGLIGGGPAVFEDVSTLSVTGTLQSNQSLIARAGNGYGPNSTLTIGAPFTAYGMVQVTGAGPGASALSVQGGVLTMAPGSHLNVDAAGGGTRSLSGDITNQGTVDLEADTAYVGGTGLFTNNGTFAVASGRTFEAHGGAGLAFHNDAGGSIANQGVFYCEGGLGFTNDGGSTSGNPVRVDGCELHVGGLNPCSFEAVGDVRLTGWLQVGQKVSVHGGAYHTSANLTVVAPFDSYGQIYLTDSSTGGASLSVEGSPLGLTIGPGGSIVVDAGDGGSRSIQGDITNFGTVVLGKLVENGGSGKFANCGAFNILVGCGYRQTGSGTFANQAGGTISNAGEFSFQGSSFWSSGGSTTGIPPELRTVFRSSGGGSSTYRFSGTSTFFGSLGPSQTVEIFAGGSFDPNATANVGGAFSGGGIGIWRIGKTDWTVAGSARLLKTATGGSQAIYEVGFGRVF